MRAEGHHAIVHTAAASALGQMLVKYCASEGVPLVNIVRKDEQVSLLKSLGAEHVVNSSADTFRSFTTYYLPLTTYYLLTYYLLRYSQERPLLAYYLEYYLLLTTDLLSTIPSGATFTTYYSLLLTT